MGSAPSSLAERRAQRECGLERDDHEEANHGDDGRGPRRDHARAIVRTEPFLATAASYGGDGVLD